MMKKRILGIVSFFVVAALLMSCLSVPAVAISDSALYGGGAGTAQSPYLISTATHLKNLADAVNGGKPYIGIYFRLEADISLNDDSGWMNWTGSFAPSNRWTPIGNYSADKIVFSGCFDGAGHSVSGMYVSGGSNVGMFGVVYGGTIKNLSIKKSYINAQSYVGGIAGRVMMGYDASHLKCNSYILACSNDGTVIGSDYVGGICGSASDATISDCYNSGSVSGSSAVGGIAGGGLFGANDAVVKNCYIAGRVTGGKGTGCIAGSSTTIIPESKISVNNCYYLDTCVAYDTSVRTNNINGTALSVSQMAQQSSFSGFDFAGVWTIGGQSGYLYPTHRKTPVSSVELSEDAISLILGETQQLTVRVLPEDAFDKSVSWSSSNSSVAMVNDSGNVLARGVGTATISVVTSDGAKSASCTVEVSERHIHNMSGWTVKIQPTCTSAGRRSRICTLPGCMYSENNTVDPLGHDYESAWTVDVEPTCVKTGSRSHHCKRCGEAGTGETIEMTAHTFFPWSVLTQPGYCTYGYRERSCTLCKFSESESMSPLEATHSVSAANGKIEVDYSDNVFSGTMKAQVTEISSGRLFDDVGRQMGKKTFRLYSLAYSVNDTPVQPNGNVYVTVMLDADFLSATSSVYRVSSDGRLTEIRTMLEGGGLGFETDSTLTFAVADEASGISSILMGDVDFDGKIKANDARRVLRVAAGLDVFDTQAEQSADISGDGKIKSNDARQILRIAAGLEPGGAIVEYEISKNTADSTAALVKYTGAGGAVIIPEKIDGFTVTSISAGAFSGLANVASVSIPASVKSISDSAFSGCRKLANINVDFSNSNYSSVDGVLFNKSGNTLLKYPERKTGNYSVGSNVTKIGKNAFSNCKGLTGIDISKSKVEIIDDYAFSDCDLLSAVNLPYTLKDIGQESFRACLGLSAVTIPDSVCFIYSGAFKDCSRLKSITLSEINGLDIISDAFDGTAYAISNRDTDSGVLYIGRHLINSNKSDSLTSYKIKDSTLSIARFAFRDCTKLMNITIPLSVRYIGRDAFKNTGYFNTESNWEYGVLYISKYIVNARPETNIKSYTPRGGTVGIAASAFSGHLYMDTINLLPGLKTIGSFAFSKCLQLKNVVIPASVETIGYAAFNQCSSLEKIAIPALVKTISPLTFEGCSSLASVTLNSGLEEISSGAFLSCKNLTGISIPDSVKILAAYSVGFSLSGTGEYIKENNFTLSGSSAVVREYRNDYLS